MVEWDAWWMKSVERMYRSYQQKVCHGEEEAYVK